MTQSEEITKLQEERAEHYHNLVKYHSLMIRAKRIYEHYLSLNSAHETAWRAADRKLAMLDGRLTIEPPAGSGPKVKKEPEQDLTIEQIERLCEKFGIELPEADNDKG